VAASQERIAEYDPIDMLCIAAAREIIDGEAILVGMGPPLLACSVAKVVNAPNMAFVTESGPMDWTPSANNPKSPSQIADPALTENSALVGDMIDALGMFLMGGGADAAVFQAAQIDLFGNMNTMLIGTYANPKRRFPGTGGNVDGGASANRMISTLPLEARRFRPRVDFRTTAGYLDGPGERVAAGLKPQGPNVCVTTKCIFRYDTLDGGESGSCEMYLDALFEGVTVEDVRDVIPWELRVADELKRTSPPTAEEMAAIGTLDSERIHRVPGRY
jgi:glutaconate CoA-transferase subunit B